jgi:hypothetical protein
MLPRIADGCDLNIGVAEQIPGISPALAARAHQSEVDFLAGRHEFGAAQNMTRNNNKGGCHGGGSQKFPAVHRLACCIQAHKWFFANNWGEHEEMQGTVQASFKFNYFEDAEKAGILLPLCTCGGMALTH